MTKYYLNDVEITPDEARKLIPISITEEVVILRERTDKEMELLYKKEIKRLIRLRYDIDDELAILRQRDTKPTEYEAYNKYVEECKSLVKQKVNKYGNNIFT